MREDSEPAADRQTASPAAQNDGLSDEERARIRDEELHAFQERAYRRQVRQEMSGSSFWNRVARAFRGEPDVFSEVAADPNATRQAVLVLTGSLGLSAIWTTFLLLAIIPLGLVAALINAGLVCLAARLFAADPPPYARLFRALGFASAPTAIGVVPLLGGFVAAIYVVVLDVIAIREVCRVSTMQAVFTFALAVVLPWFVFLGALAVIGFSSIGWGELGRFVG